MAVTSSIFSVYEKLASAKMNSLVTDINAHTHNGTYGVKINYTNLSGNIPASAIANNTITSAMITDGTITSADIANDTITTADIKDDTITIDDINTTSIKLDSSTGYALYAA